MSSESNIVVPWDFSEHSKCALDFAVKRFSTCRLHIVCVLERPNPYSPGEVWGEDAERNARAKCEQRFLETVNASRFPGLQFHAEFGDPATEIVRFANARNSEMIVISTHGRSGIQRLVLGSVAQKISLLANCPVLLLPHHWFEAAIKGQRGSGKTAQIGEGE